MNFSFISSFLLSLKKEAKLKDFARSRRIDFQVDRSKKIFVISTLVYSEDQYISKEMAHYALDKTFSSSLDTFLWIDKQKHAILLKQHIPFSHTERSVREILLEFVDIAKDSISQLEDLSNENLLFL